MSFSAISGAILGGIGASGRVTTGICIRAERHRSVRNACDLRSLALRPLSLTGFTASRFLPAALRGYDIEKKIDLHGMPRFFAIYGEQLSFSFVIVARWPGITRAPLPATSIRHVPRIRELDVVVSIGTWPKSLREMEDRITTDTLATIATIATITITITRSDNADACSSRNRGDSFRKGMR